MKTLAPLPRFRQWVRCWSLLTAIGLALVVLQGSAAAGELSGHPHPTEATTSLWPHWVKQWSQSAWQTTVGWWQGAPRRARQE